ncbi:hypothetical protein GE061_016778 [Apolygus lucorum]|uniref:Uncharacterized protein n=1 Tax=Apolygus lucorum TaxID=248454 RepID=A0A8S9XIE8_APOLU|nr:hypothetical protein GE061_016778 [Apolygus lucorum]
MSIEARPEVFQIVADESNVYFVTRDEVTYFLKYEEKTQSAVPQLSVPGLKKIILGHELVVALPSPGDVTLKRIWVYKKGFYSRPLGTRTITGYSVVSLCPPHYVVYSEDMQVSVWDPVTKRTVSHFGTGAMVTFLRPAFSSFLLVFMGTSLHLWDWKTGERLYRLYSGLEWTGNYGNLLWANASSILSGGVDHQLEMISFM